jgi:hypothetical protein
MLSGLTRRSELLDPDMPTVVSIYRRPASRLCRSGGRAEQSPAESPAQS